MPYDTAHRFIETAEEHATRLKRSLRWTKIRRRTLLLKLEGQSPDEIRRQMGDTNCPYELAYTSAADLMAALAVTPEDTLLLPDRGREPAHPYTAVQDAADAAGLEISVHDLTRDLAWGSNKLALAQAGVMIGHPSYGYKQHGRQQVLVANRLTAVARVVFHPVERPAMDLLFEMYADTHPWSFTQIGLELDRQGFPTRTGKPWDAEALRDMLRSPTYAGFILYRGTEDRRRRDAGTLYPGLHPAIVTWTAFCQAQDRRVQRDPRQPQARWICPWQNAPDR